MSQRGRERRERRVQAARDLRRRMTPAEKVLWHVLRNRQFDNLKFRRQVPFGPFVTDFCCMSCRLVIEVDDGIHDEQREQDRARTDIFAAHGFRVIRFSNDEVLTSLESVLDQIQTTASQPLPPRPGSSKPARSLIYRKDY